MFCQVKLCTSTSERFTCIDRTLDFGTSVAYFESLQEIVYWLTEMWQFIQMEHYGII